MKCYLWLGKTVMWDQTVEAIEANRNAALQMNIKNLKRKKSEDSDGDDDETSGEEKTRITVESIGGLALKANSNPSSSDCGIKDSVGPR
ncbi:hypothetical protein BWQ96_01920 [Gracilariopsis chorda]|uniref:Uncharacterized protein n=1 Tax=Gracilariopsis chorda TaxID=448386 RepID=A0A2V3J1D9_9FLOR|nr:hypothetical protein BWQ96_01920 [Gracilariopsis chorda]|eukprot:PXF48231.1 hypothetical protein BWQ96_01920 [Gracilariopsis chorda]